MKKLSIIIILLLIFFFMTDLLNAEPKNPLTPNPKGKYFGQKLPGLTPEIFAPGIVSTGLREFASSFSPDGTEFYSVNAGGPHAVLVVFKQKDNLWTKPEVLPFSGTATDYDPMVSYDGKHLFFCSLRPVKPGEKKRDADMWVCDRKGDSWSEPRHMGATLNSESSEYYPCVTKNGTLYFTSGRKGGYGASDIYRSRLVNGEYGEPENLGDAINSKTFEGDVFPAADESFLIVTCYGREDSLGSGDLYISFRQKDGSWSKLKNMGSPINSVANEHCPMVSKDGKIFFFTSYRNTVSGNRPLTYDTIIKMQTVPGNGKGDIYWVDAKIIDKYREN